MDSSVKSDWVGHIEFGKWLTNRLKPKLLVDLGTYEGVSALSFASGCNETEIITIDKYERQLAHDTVNMVNNIEYRISTFNEQVDTFEDKSIDILHIDGSHDFKSIVNDCMLWTPKLKEDGVLLMHDVYNPGWIGPITVFITFISMQKIMFLNSQGLGVASRNDKLLREIYQAFPGMIATGTMLNNIYNSAKLP